MYVHKAKNNLFSGNIDFVLFCKVLDVYWCYSFVKPKIVKYTGKLIGPRS